MAHLIPDGKGMRLLFLLLALSGIVRAQELPTSVDLKAMYCLKITNLGIRELSSYPDSGNKKADEIVRDSISIAQDRSKRINSYLLPRFPFLDMTAMEIASKRADIDFRDSRQFIESCMAKRIGACDDPKTGEQYQACMKQCDAGNDAGKRVQSCVDTSWLPF